ncbi:hypothetical protein [Acidovorax sp. Q11]
MPRIGETPCCNPACTCTDATVNQTGGGKLQAKCHKCGTERWAPLGTKAHRDLMAQTRLDDEGDQYQNDPPPLPAEPMTPERANRLAPPYTAGKKHTLLG